MANFIALRDQENFVDCHQTAAAAKPQNQGARQLQPKTPGHQAPKTPFKIPLNDENAAHGNKTRKVGGKGDENHATGRKGMLQDKSAFVTPLAAPRTRAPLGQKTTNAKARPFNTPTAGRVNNGLANSKPPSSKVRRITPKLVHTQPTKLNVLLDTPLEEQEIEYMPPRPEPLPDKPDDIPADFDLSVFAKSDREQLAEAFTRYYHEPDASGLSLADRDRQREERNMAHEEREMFLIMERDAAVSAFECYHEPECEGQCKDRGETVRKAEDRFQAGMAALKEAFPDDQVASQEPEAPKTSVQIKKDGPSSTASAQAAAALSMLHSTPSAGAPSYAKPTQAAAAKSAAAAPSTARKLPMASNACNGLTPGAVASRNTMGYAKGRSTVAALREFNDKSNAGSRATVGGARTGDLKAGANQQTRQVPVRQGVAAGGTGIGQVGLQSRLTDGADGKVTDEDLWRDCERENNWLREHVLVDT